MDVVWEKQSLLGQHTNLSIFEPFDLGLRETFGQAGQS